MKVKSNKLSDVIQFYENKLSEKFNQEESKFFIRDLIEFYIKIPKFQISLNLNKRLSESQLLKIHFGVKDLIANKPLQYIYNTAYFHDKEFYVNSSTLIPRPETEELVQLIIDNHKKDIYILNVLDIGTGSGCIAITLQTTLNADVKAVDISKDAIKVAQQNAQKHNADVKFFNIDFLDSENHKPIESKYDIIVSNPPYVRNQEKSLMSDNVLEFEPEIALFVEDNDPLLHYKAIAQFASKNLKENGVLWLEINEFLSNEMNVLLSKYFKKVSLINDFRNKKRFCKASINHKKQ